MISPKKITVRTLARKAGVSACTISMALRNNPRVSSKTAERIQKIAQQLGYRINPFISAFMRDLKRSQRTGLGNITLAYLARLDVREKKSDRVMSPQIKDGAFNRAQELNYKIETFIWNQPGMTDQRLSKILYTRNIQGVIIAPLAAKSRLSLDWSHFSCVIAGQSAEHSNMHRVVSDTYSNMLLALQNLHQLGYQRIGLALELRLEIRSSFRYSSAYLGFHQHLKIKKNIPPFLRDPFRKKDFWEWYRKYSPDAIITAAPAQAPWIHTYGVLPWLREAGVDVPGKVGVVSLGLPIEPYPITGVDVKSSLVGATCVEMLEAQLIRNERGIPHSPKLILVPGEWRDGSTTRKQ